jgi:hypothetical protein
MNHLKTKILNILIKRISKIPINKMKFHKIIFQVKTVLIKNRVHQKNNSLKLIIIKD